MMVLCELDCVGWDPVNLLHLSNTNSVYHTEVDPEKRHKTQRSDSLWIDISQPPQLFNHRNIYKAVSLCVKARTAGQSSVSLFGPQ